MLVRNGTLKNTAYGPTKYDDYLVQVFLEALVFMNNPESFDDWNELAHYLCVETIPRT